MSQTLQRQEMEAELLRSGRISPEQAKFFSQEQARAIYEPQEITQEQIQAQAIAQRSEDFYKGIGYPQYGGKYEPFVTPEGYRVKEVKEGIEGLQVAFEPLPEAPSLSDQILGLLPKGVSGNLGDIIMGKWLGVEVAPESPLAVPAGVVASVESLVYSVGRLVGLQTPRIPATLAGGLVSSVIETGVKGGALNVGFQETPELKEVREKGGAYAAGTLLGDTLLALGMGKVAQKAISPVVGKIKGSAAKWLTESYEESARLRELWKPSLAERLGMKLTGAAPKEFSTAIIGLPRMAEAEALGMTNMSKFMMGMEAFEWTEVPRTVGFGLTEPILEAGRKAAKEGLMAGVKQVAKETLPYVVYQAGRQVSLAQPTGILGFEKVRYTMGYSAKLGFAKERLPSLKDLLKDTKAETTLSKLIFQPTQRILPRLSMLPELAAEGLPKVAPQIFGAGFLIPHLLGREVQKPKREAKVKPLTRLAVGSVAKTILSQRQQPMQIPKQTTRQVQKQQQIQIQRIPVPQIPALTFPIPRVPRLPEGSSLASAILGTKGAWFYKRHPVATGKEVAAHIFGGLQVPRSKGKAGKIDLASALMERKRRRKR